MGPELSCEINLNTPSLKLNVPQRIRYSLLFICCFFLLSSQSLSQPPRGRISIGGMERVKANAWGLLKGQYENKTDQDQSVTTVVTQQSTSGNQFARTTLLPPKTVCVTQWPIFVQPTADAAFEFDYMNVVDENGRETINRRSFDQMVESFSVSAKSQHEPGVPGFCLNLVSDGLSEAELIDIERLSVGLRQSARLPRMIANHSHHVINGQSECLGPIDQMVIGAADLSDSPASSEAIRFWIERGGRALMFMNLMGEDSARAVLGDACPFTVIDETSPRLLNLRHHRQSSGVRRHTDLSYEREMAEPVRQIRAMFETGTVLWSMDGWPVLVKVRVGNGTVLVCTVSPRVLLTQDTKDELDPCAVVVLEELFRGQREPPLLTESVLAEAAQTKIGYSIPSRTFPIVVLALFVVVLAIVGWWLSRNERQGWLTVAAPAVAALAAIPGLAMGLANRTAIPPTLLETRVVFAPVGQTALVADGVTTVYQPDSQEMDLALADSAVILPQKDTGSTVKGRQVWDGPDSYQWQNFSQPAGVSNYRQQSIVRLPNPLTANATLDSKGLQIQLSNAELLQPEDLIIASISPERMVARCTANGVFRSEFSDLLAPGEISNNTMLSEQQVERKKLYEELFDDGDRAAPFPSKPSLLFWTNQLDSAISSEVELRRETSTLVVAPLQFSPPEFGQTVSIPPALLPYYSIPDADGSIGAVYTNRSRKWLQRPSAGSLVIRFDLPSSCQPFEFEAAELQLRILAGSRTLIVQAGQVGNFTDVKVIQSPVGNFNIDLPINTLNESGGKSVIVKLSVGEVEFEKGDENSLSANQESYWKIERVLLSVQGMRTNKISSEDDRSK